MSDANDEDGKTPAAPAPGGRAPLTLKPRVAGSVPTGTVRQSFSHGRSKTVVVETKRRRTDAPLAPVAPEKRAAPTAFDVKARPRPEAPTQAAPAREDKTPGGLSAEEMEARRRVIEAAQHEKERRDAEQAERDSALASEEAARVKAEKAAAKAAEPAPAPEVEAKAEPASKKSAPKKEAAPETEATPEPERIPEPVAADAAPERTAARAAPAAAPRPTLGAPVRPLAPRPTSPRAPREGAPAGAGGYGARAPREGAGGGGGFGSRAPAGGGSFGSREGGATARAPREGAAAAGGGYGTRQATPGETVRYSALAPRAGAGAARPGGTPRPGARGPAGASEAPSGPEVTRPTRGAPHARPGGRRDDDDRGKGGGDAGKAVSRTKGEPKRREGRLTIQAVAGDGDTAERMRSLASVRRAREREKEKRKGGAQDAPKVAREVIVPDVITVQELSNRMAVRGVDIIKFLMRQGMMLKINDVIDSDTAELVAADFGHTVRRVSESDVEEGFIDEKDNDADTLPRPPVVAVMGHVDHGKTSLLDALRATDVVAGEAGGITQHIGAYQVRLESGQRVTFLDTPGHAAFSAMRMRGANVTDIVVLVVAADDGVMPQTIEAINHAKAAGAPIIVAINKIDKPDADPTRVINELLQHEIVVEALGGDTQVVEVSALKKTGLSNLVDAILVQAEVMDLRANPTRSAEGVVVEAKLDKGRGPVATVLVKRGTMKRGEIVVAGSHWGRVRALTNERGEQVDTAGPSEPVEVLGLDGAPEPGDQLAVVEDEARARELTEYRDRKRREKSGAPASAGVSLADMMSKLQDKKLKELPIIIKADVQGSAEAIVGSLAKLATDEVRARIILSGVGGINESDVLLAKGAGSPIIGFNVRASKQARDLAEREGVEIRYYAIIYDLIDDIKGVLSGMLAPIQRETFLGNAEVLEAFDISKVGKVAGCRVTEGLVRRGAKVRVLRSDVVILELGTLQTLKRFKDDVNEVQVGQECGMSFAGFQDIKKGDFIECFTVEEVKRSL
ncbi:MAG TPA: translation initiation factor IF-2 [Caulobacteraceae bacterium]|jgi:translation initiation factor IF-2|nr:translation initiation factor IF-2 [Caulobacteraceae bacterium]